MMGSWVRVPQAAPLPVKDGRRAAGFVVTANQRPFERCLRTANADFLGCHNDLVDEQPDVSGPKSIVAVAEHVASGLGFAMRELPLSWCLFGFLPAFAGMAKAADQDLVLRNPQNSVHVRIHPCGKSRCGTVVWANEKAKVDSARGGTRNLVGTELFREFREVSPKVWKGKVFVPDLNKVFTGTATVKDQNLVVARAA